VSAQRGLFGEAGFREQLDSVRTAFKNSLDPNGDPTVNLPAFQAAREGCAKILRSMDDIVAIGGLETVTAIFLVAPQVVEFLEELRVLAAIEAVLLGIGSGHSDQALQEIIGMSDEQFDTIRHALDGEDVKARQ
jgi:hypothetical protein